MVPVDTDSAEKSAPTRGRKPARRPRPASATEARDAVHGVTDQDVVRAGYMAVRKIQNTEMYKPQRAGGYVRISNDPYGLERGVTRQTEDIYEKAVQLGWTITKIYPENDTSAYRKKKITLADGTVVWRVIRPQFRQMLQDLFTGVIDGVIVYDQDRLLRQPRDLEDLIDIVEAVQRPVTGITSSINLMTSDGRAMARVMAAIALKASEDSARRVTRAHLQDALDGYARVQRRFGVDAEGNPIEAEAQAAETAARIALATGKWYQATKYLERESGQTPVEGGHWHANSVRNMLLNPSIAGISVYRGTMRVGDVNGKMNAADPQADAVRDAEGEYVRTGQPETIPVDLWEALCIMARESHEGKTRGEVRAKKYLLSGLLRCGNLRKDGAMCGRSLHGTIVKQPTKADPERRVVLYRCSGIAQGGCSGVARRADKTDEFIEELFFKFLETKAPKTTIPAQEAEPQAVKAAKARLAIVQERLTDLRKRYTDGDPNLSAESYYATLPDLEHSVREAQTKLNEVKRGTPAQFSAQDVAEEWRGADVDGKRMILARYLAAIEMGPSKARGRAPFETTSIRPIWKTAKDTTLAVELAA